MDKVFLPHKGNVEKFVDSSFAREIGFFFINVFYFFFFGSEGVAFLVCVIKIGIQNYLLIFS